MMCKTKIMVIVYSMVCLYYIIFSCNDVLGLYTQPVPMEPSTISVIDWQSCVLKMLQEVSFFNHIHSDSVLLVNIIKNNTRENIPVHKITNLLIHSILENTTKYQVIHIEQLYSAYRKLGIFPENHINSYNFSIDIANYLQANYVLYSIIYGDLLHPSIELQLILVKTGEIIDVINKTI